MQKRALSVNDDGFYGVWYPNPKVKSARAIILMLGDSADSRMVCSGATWIHRQGFHALAVSPEKKALGRHNEPLERVGKAIAFLHSQGCEKIGVLGASATGMMALVAASYYPDISLTIAMTPPDFVIEGYYRDKTDGALERPGDQESSVSWRGRPLAYLPYAYRHPTYWQKIKEEAKAGDNILAARNMFDESERLHPLTEEEKIKIERVNGKVVCIGAEDDALWDTCKYIRRMQQRLKSLPHTCDFEALTYEHGTHFVFPESMLKLMLPIGSGLFVRFMFKAAREYSKECRETRLDIDRGLMNILSRW